MKGLLKCQVGLYAVSDQCRDGGEKRKRTGWAGRALGLSVFGRRCNHGRHGHAQARIGKGPWGTFLTKGLETYPTDLCRRLATMFLQDCLARRGSLRPETPPLHVFGAELLACRATARRGALHLLHLVMFGPTLRVLQFILQSLEPATRRRYASAEEALARYAAALNVDYEAADESSQDYCIADFILEQYEDPAASALTLQQCRDVVAAAQKRHLGRRRVSGGLPGAFDLAVWSPGGPGGASA